MFTVCCRGVMGGELEEIIYIKLLQVVINDLYGYQNHYCIVSTYLLYLYKYFWRESILKINKDHSLIQLQE